MVGDIDKKIIDKLEFTFTELSKVYQVKGNCVGHVIFPVKKVSLGDWAS